MAKGTGWKDTALINIIWVCNWFCLTAECRVHQLLDRHYIRWCVWVDPKWGSLLPATGWAGFKSCVLHCWLVAISNYDMKSRSHSNSLMKYRKIIWPGASFWHCSRRILRASQGLIWLFIFYKVGESKLSVDVLRRLVATWSGPIIIPIHSLMLTWSQMPLPQIYVIMSIFFHPIVRKLRNCYFILF